MKKSILISLFSAYSLFMFSAGNIIDLSGKWSFAIDKNDMGATEKWFSKIIQDDVIQLPGSMTENLKGDDITLDTKFTGSIYDSSWYYNPRMEKYRQPQNLKMPFWLTQNKHYVGVAWYQRTIDIPKNWSGSNVILFLEQPHFTSRVWVDNTEVGSQNSLTTPHVFDLTTFLKPGKHRLTISVDNRMKDVDVGANSHSVTDHTQGNWNGIVGKMQLQARSLVHFDDIQVYPNIKNKTALVKITVQNNLKNSFKGFISLYLGSFNSDKAQMFAPVRIPLSAVAGKTEMEYTINFGDEMLTWDEFHPALYRMTLELQAGKQTDSRELQFGMREITIDGKYFYINGRKTMLRGTVENALFPLTGYPPRDEASWERVFRICKSYGLNHMRFHSYCPPEAAFIAADKIGFYLQPEGPSWPNHSTQLGRGLPIDTYLMDETKRMVKAYGNYASFTFLACGNEPRGAWVPWVTKFVNYWKQADHRRVYTGASVGQSWAWQPASQYHVKAGARGLDWKSNQPETLSDYGARIDSIKQPYVSHETGQWCVFPNFDEIKKYTGVTRAKNFELFQEDLVDNDMSELSHEFLMASGHLQALCYKHEIERTLRTPGYAGFQLLSLNDYSGQGTALVGVLDAFWDEKGYMTAPEFRHFCNSTVPLLRTEKFVYRNNETLKAAVEIAHFGESPLNNAKIVWKIKDAYGLILEQGVLAETNIPIGANFEVGNIEKRLMDYDAPQKINLEISVEGTDFSNDWNFWIYPAQTKQQPTDGIYIADSLDTKAVEILNNGGKVLILAAGKIQYGKDVVQQYQPAFWNTSWFKMRPPHTTGVFVNNYHPVFKDFVTDNWGDMQWWELVNRTQTMLLTDFPKGFQPIVQPIDTWFINRKLGMLFEAKVGKGKLLMTSCDLQSSLSSRPVAAQLYSSIINYMQSDKFRPEKEVPLQNISDLFTKTAAPINFFTKNSPDELKKDVK